MGILSVMYLTCSGVNWSKIGVRTTAGATAFTQIPSVATSFPSDFVKPMTAALVAE